MSERSTAGQWLRGWGAVGIACLLALPACDLLKRGKDKEESSAAADTAKPASEGKSTAAAPESPANSEASGEAPAAALGVGSKVQVQWKGRWYPATILAVGTNGTYKIHYDGWGAEWDEWVTPARMRDTAGSAPATPAAAAHKVGEKVQVSWKGKWYPATILAVGTNGTYKVHYDGWGAEWDEWVTPARMR